MHSDSNAHFINHLVIVMVEARWEHVMLQAHRIVKCTFTPVMLENVPY